MPATTKKVCKSNEEDMELRRGPWTLEEDSMLIHYITCHGEGRWNLLAKCAGLKRTGKSCRLRWLNYLKPDIKRGNLTPQEQLLILELHSKWGNRWSKIAQHLPGRTDNEIKNYWRTRVQKQARQLNIESNSKRFVDAVRCFWMPRLVQKMEQTSSPANSSLKSMDSQISSAPNSLVSSSSSPPPRNPIPTTTSNSSEYSMKISEQSQVSENPAGPFHAFDCSAVYNHPNLTDCHFVDSRSFDMEALIQLDPMSSTTTYDNSLFDCHMADADWLSDNMANSLWNLYE